MTPEEIKTRLKEKKLRQSDLCERFNTSPATIHYLIHGKLRSDKLEKRLARVLGVTLAELRAEPQGQQAVNG